MNISTIRGVTYAVALLSGVAAAWLAAKGLGTYDPETGMFDLAPFSVPTVAGIIVSAGGNLLAGLAWLKGWVRK